MSEMFRCGDGGALVAYLYDDIEANERAAIAAHVETCATCAAELESLGATRQLLAAWRPPEAALGFQLTPRQVSGPRLHQSAGAAGPGDGIDAMPGPSLRWWSRPLPAWAQLAAAIVLFASGLALGRAQQTGSALPGRAGAVQPAPTATPVAAVKPAAAPAVTAQDLAAVEQRLLGEVARVRAAAPAPARSDSVSVRQVQALIEDSELRQRRELALRTAEIVRDFDTQRRVDLMRVQQSVGQVEAMTGAQVRDQRQIANWLRTALPR